MKKILSTFLFSFFLFLGVQAQSFIGGGLQYYAEPSDLGIQLKGEFGINDSWALEGSAAYVIADGNPFIIDANAHYRVLRINETTFLSPLAGLSVALIDGDSDLVLNLGAELLVPIQERHIYIQPKYSLLGDRDSFVISAGIFL